MYWLVLLAAGFLEIGFTSCLKLSAGFSKPLPTVGFIIFAIASFGCLTFSLKGIPLGTAYAVWTAIGAVGTAVAGILWFKEPATFWRLFFLGGIIICIVGLKFFTPTELPSK